MLETNLYSIDILNEKNQSVFKDMAGLFNSLTIIEKLWNIAYFELELNSIDLDFFKPFKNLKLQFKSSTIQFESDLGINSVIRTQNILTIKGYMTKWENFKVSNTRYLADNLQDAIIALGVKDSFNKIDSFPTQLGGKLYQVNTTNLSQCIDLCRIASQDGFWAIGKDNIKLFTNNINKDIPIPSDYSVEIYPSKVDNEEVEIAETPKELYTSGFYRNASCIWDNQYNNHFINYLQRLKNEQLGMPMYLTFKGSMEYPYPIASVGKNSLNFFPNITQWIVASVTTFIKNEAIETNVVLGGLE